jgi:hypothetical protein
MHPVGKFVAVKAVVFFSFWQASLPCRPCTPSPAPSRARKPSAAPRLAQQQQESSHLDSRSSAGRQHAPARTNSQQAAGGGSTSRQQAAGSEGRRQKAVLRLIRIPCSPPPPVRLATRCPAALQHAGHKQASLGKHALQLRRQARAGGRRRVARRSALSCVCVARAGGESQGEAPYPVCVWPVLEASRKEKRLILCVWPVLEASRKEKRLILCVCGPCWRRVARRSAPMMAP